MRIVVGSSSLVFRFFMARYARFRRRSSRTSRYNRRIVGYGTRRVMRQRVSRIEPDQVRRTRFTATKIGNCNLNLAQTEANRVRCGRTNGTLLVDPNINAGTIWRSVVHVNGLGRGPLSGQRVGERIHMLSLHLSGSMFYNPFATTANNEIISGALTQASFVDRSYLLLLVYFPGRIAVPEPPSMQALFDDSYPSTRTAPSRDSMFNPRVIWTRRGRLQVEPNGSQYACSSRSRHDFDVKIPLNLPARYLANSDGGTINHMISGQLCLYFVSNLQYDGAFPGMTPYFVGRMQLYFCDV